MPWSLGNLHSWPERTLWPRQIDSHRTQQLLFRSRVEPGRNCSVRSGNHSVSHRRAGFLDYFWGPYCDFRSQAPARSCRRTAPGSDIFPLHSAPTMHRRCCPGPGPARSHYGSERLSPSLGPRKFDELPIRQLSPPLTPVPPLYDFLRTFSVQKEDS